MKVAYLSYPFFADTDFSFINELNKKEDVYYFINLSPYSLNSTAFNIKHQIKKPGIFKINQYEELTRFNELINQDKSFIINRTSQKGYSLSNIILNIALFFRLLKLNPDIIHCTSYFEYSDFILYFFRKKIVLTVHDPFPHIGENDRRVIIYRNIAYRLIKNFVLLNGKQKDEFINRNKLEKKKIFISRLGIYSYLSLYASEEVNESNKTILFFGRISAYKGLEYLLPAFKVVHEKFPDIKLIVAGSGKFYFDIEEYQQLDYIQFINRHVPDNELVSLIESSLFVVCPYTEATQSGVIMSAFALNKPVLATNTGGISEYVQNDITGKLIKPKSVDSIASTIISMIERPEILKKYSDNIQNLYSISEYSWKTIVNELTGFYKEVIAKY